jgi:hypothetical protein
MAELLTVDTTSDGGGSMAVPSLTPSPTEREGMRDDATSEALALQTLEQSGWNIWITAKRQELVYGAKNPSELLKLIHHKQPERNICHTAK